MCNPGSAHLIEEVVRTQMNSSLIQCYETALSRAGEEGGILIGLAEILFLMRKDTLKSVRLLKHLNLKDTLSAPNSSSSAAPGINFDTLSSSGLSSDDWTSVQSMSASLLEPNLIQTPTQQKKKSLSRMETCIKVLRVIDDSNEIIDCYNDDDYVDLIKFDRNVRIDKLTKQMSESEYVAFTQARTVSFSSKSKLQKFRQWLMAETESVLGNTVAVDTYGMEAFQWMATELVAQIVDYCFIVQQDKKRDPTDAVQGFISSKKNQQFTMATAQPEHSCLDGHMQAARRGLKRKMSSQSEYNEPCLTYYGSISPADVREVTRRYFNSSGAGNLFNVLKKHEPSSRFFKQN